MTEAKDPRDEAERLIASVLGGASVAAENLDGFATGSPACCVCPVCKAIAAARDPDPRVAERLASGAGDLASGVASFLRTMARAAADLGNPGDPGGPSGSSGPSGSAPRSAGTATEDPWATATRAAAEAEASGAPAPGATTEARAAGHGSPQVFDPAATPNPPKPMAKKAVKPKAPTEPPAEESQPT